MLCPECGTENMNTARFCIKCGAQLTVRPTSQAPVPVETTSEAHAQAAPPRVDRRRAGLWVAIGVLAALLVASSVLLVRLYTREPEVRLVTSQVTRIATREVTRTARETVLVLSTPRVVEKVVRETVIVECSPQSAEVEVEATKVMLPPVGENVELVGQIGGSTYAVAVQGGYAYIGVGPRLTVLDISDPSSPAGVGTTSLLAGLVTDLHVSGGYAYVADGDAGLRVVDVSDPTRPSEVGFYDTPGQAHDVAVAGSYVYLADGPVGDDGNWTGGGLQVVDVSNPARPTEVGFCDTPRSAHDVAVAGSYVYVAGVVAGLRVVDVSDPARPTEVGFYGTQGLSMGVAATGRYAYLADDHGGLFILRFTGGG